jgi:DNA-binding beta-propeller fold protein YncE
MNHRFVQACAGAVLVVVTILVVGCSSGHNTFSANPSPTPTPLANPRMMVSDNQTGAVIVVNAKTDVITHTLPVLSPGKLVSAGGTTVIQSTLASSLAIFDNATETIRFTVPLPALAVDIALTPDGSTTWVAENNGTVQSINTATGLITSTDSVPGVQRLVMGPQGTSILAFNDTLAINFTVLRPPSTIPLVLGNTGLDHPANGVFSADDNHFQVFDCGRECAGTQAGIAGVALNTPGGPFISNPLHVSGATVGLLGGTTIFVAGSPATGLNAGTLQEVDTSTNTVGTPASIADGRHNQMVLTSNGRLYVGSQGCTLGATNAQNLRQGCLNIFDTVTLAVTSVLLPAFRINGDVTGLAPVAGRNVIYVVQGGQLDIFDTTTNAVSTSITPLNIAGTASGVVQLSP